MYHDLGMSATDFVKQLATILHLSCKIFGPFPTL